MSDLTNPLLENGLAANDAFAEEENTGGYVLGPGERIDEDGQYGPDLNWEDSYGPASKHLGVSEEDWQAFIAGVNEIKAEARAYGGNVARVFQQRTQGEDAVATRRIVVLMNQGYTQEEAEAEVYGSEQYLQTNEEFEQYNALNDRLSALYKSVGLDPAGYVGADSKTNSPGYQVRFDFNSGGVSHSKGSAVGKVFSAAVMGIMAYAVAGPLANALGPVLGAAGSKAAASAITNLATQYMANGEVDFKQALISAATSYGGAKLGEALAGAGELDGIAGKLGDAIDSAQGKVDSMLEFVSQGNSIAEAAIKAGGMSMLTQLVMTGEVDLEQAAMSALMAAGQQGFEEWKANMAEQLGSDEFMADLAESDEFAQAASDAGLKDPFLNPDYREVGEGIYADADGNLINAAGETIAGTLADHDADGDGMLTGDDLQTVEVPDRDLADPTYTAPDESDQYAYGGTHPDTTIEYDENGNPYVARRDVFWKDGDDQHLYFEDGTIAATNNGDGTWTFGEGEDAVTGKLVDFGFESDSGPIDFELQTRQNILAGSEKVYYDPDTNSFYNEDEAALYGMDTTDSETGHWLVRGEDGKVYVTNGYDIREYRGGLTGDDPTMNDGVERMFRERDPIWQHANNGGEAPDSPPPSDNNEQLSFPDVGVVPEDPPPTSDSTDDSAANADPNDNVDAGEGPSGGGPTDSTGGPGSSGPSGGGGTEGGGTDAGSNLPDFTLPPWLNEFLDDIDTGTDSEVPVDSDGEGLGGIGGDTGGTDSGDGTGGVGGGDESGSGDDSGPDVGDGTGTGEGGSGGGSGDSGDTAGGDGTGGGLGDGGGAGEGTGGGQNDGDGTGGSVGVGVGSGTEPGAGGGAGGGGLGGDGDGGGMMSGHDPQWGELFGYTPFKVYEPGKGLEPVSGLLKGLLK